MRISFYVNEVPLELETDPGKRLLDLLRDDLHLTGTKEGCGEGECGACTVLLDGEAVHACMVLAGQLNGHRITTIEGLTVKGKPSVLQKAFVEAGAIQCGFCTPGMIMSATAFLRKNPHPDREQVREALAGNICRCSGYVQIVDAVMSAAQMLEQGGRV